MDKCAQTESYEMKRKMRQAKWKIISRLLELAQFKPSTPVISSPFPTQIGRLMKKKLSEIWLNDVFQNEKKNSQWNWVFKCFISQFFFATFSLVYWSTLDSMLLLLLFSLHSSLPIAIWTSNIFLFHLFFCFFFLLTPLFIEQEHKTYQRHGLWKIDLKYFAAT